MANFLTGPSLTQAVTQITQTGKAKLAVAYWGSDACRLLQLPNDCSDVEIICDAFSGACNPSTLSELISRKAQVKYIDGIHAKTYIGENSALIGSANASANGLGQEAEELHTHLETGLITSEEDVIFACKKWFDTLFLAGLDLKTNHLAEIQRRWSDRRRWRPVKVTKTSGALSEVFLRHPDQLKDRRIFVYAYRNGPIPTEVITTYEQSSFNNLQPEEHGGYQPFYYGASDWDVRVGDIILDFAFKRTKLHFTGFWEVRGRIEKHQIVAVRIVNHVLSISVTSSDLTRLLQATKTVLDRGFLALEKLTDAWEVYYDLSETREIV